MQNRVIPPFLQPRILTAPPWCVESAEVEFRSFPLRGISGGSGGKLICRHRQNAKSASIYPQITFHDESDGGI
jgi:hypothetical protein